MNALPLYCYIFIASLAVSHSVYFYPALPQTMASHFGSGGAPNTFVAKQSFFAVAGVVLLINIFVFMAIPWLFQRFRVKRMNLPNKRYWLAPERLDHVYEYFRNKMALFGIINLLFGVAVMHLVFLANLQGEGKLDNTMFLLFLIAYFAFVIIWLISFFKKFSRIS